MTLLTAVQNVCCAVGIPKPSSVVGNNDVDIEQLLALMKEEGRSLSRRYPWQALQRTFSHTTTAATNQGAVSAIMPGILWQHNQTLWNSTQQDPIRGAITAQLRQAKLSLTEAGPYYDYWVENGDLNFYPTPTAGDVVTGVYISNYWVNSSSGTDQTNWQADSDVCVIDETDFLLEMGLKWRWLRSRKFDYIDERNEYEAEVKQAMARDAGAELKYLGGTGLVATEPYARAPEGSWNL